ncbi:hypothetical protein BC628DRAFT_1421693 [Trametes gibbosa]|nr:hypothetical protein BC628DRAFT_1421693 [Trametes gibbosa]
MSTLVENVLLLLLIYVVYSYRPQAGGNLTATSSPPILSNRMPGEPANRSDTPGISAEAAIRANKATVFRASTPLVPARSPSVRYEVAVKIEPPTDVVPTVRRVFEVQTPTEKAFYGLGTLHVPHGSRDRVFHSSHSLYSKTGITNYTSSEPGAHDAAPFDTYQDQYCATTERSLRQDQQTPRVVQTSLTRVTGSGTIAESSRAASSLPGPQSASTRTTRAPPKAQKKKPSADAPRVRVSFPALERHFRTFRNFSGVLCDDGEPIGTGWFRSDSSLEVVAPPDVSAFSKIHRGDIYYHRAPTGPQLWLLVRDATAGPLRWKAVALGYRREDGRKLSLTKGNLDPTWTL